MRDTTNQQIIVVRIEQVDIDNRLVHARDKTDSPIQATWRSSAAGILHVPTAGEKWTARRLGGKLGGQWSLEDKLDTMDDHAWVVEHMQPGDTRVDGDTVWIRADEVRINERRLGPTVRDFFYSPSSAFTSVTLAGLPVSIESVQPFLNGLLCEPSLYTLSGRTLTFTPTMAAGHLVVYYQSIVVAYDDVATITGRALVSGVDLYP